VRTIEAVTVSVNYADYLAETLPALRAAVDAVTVVTSPSDRRTATVARRYGARVVQTTAMFDDSRKFSLGAALGAGLRTLDRDDWVLVIDADIVLMKCARWVLHELPLDDAKLYGIDRVHCRGWQRWQDLCTLPRVVRTAAVTAHGLPFADRIAFVDQLGYKPCGFFQLWNPLGSGIHDYPIDPGGTAGHSDMMHAARWPREARELIPELIGIELQSEDAGDRPVGANWSGRRTAEFSASGGAYRR